jgi:hypothetical protein
MSDFRNHETSAVLERVIEAARRENPDDDPEYWDLVQELHRRTDQEIFAAATAWCESPEAALRCLGADVLGQLGFTAQYPFAAASAPVLTSLLSDTHPMVVDSALTALGHLHAGDETVIAPLADHESADVRHAVAYCLGGRDGDLVRRTLIQLTADRERDVRDWATFALGTLTDDADASVREALAARLDDPDAETRGEAVKGLARRGDPRALPLIVAALADSADDVSYLAVDAVVEMSDALAHELLAVADRHPDGGRIRLDIERYRSSRRR